MRILHCAQQVRLVRNGSLDGIRYKISLLKSIDFSKNYRKFIRFKHFPIFVKARTHLTEAVQGCLCSAGMDCACLPHTEHQQNQAFVVASV